MQTRSRLRTDESRRSSMGLSLGVRVTASSREPRSCSGHRGSFSTSVTGIVLQDKTRGAQAQPKSVSCFCTWIGPGTWSRSRKLSMWEVSHGEPANQIIYFLRTADSRRQFRNSWRLGPLSRFMHLADLLWPGISSLRGGIIAQWIFLKVSTSRFCFFLKCASAVESQMRNVLCVIYTPRYELQS